MARTGRAGAFTGVIIPFYMLYITDLAIYRTMEPMVVRRREAEDREACIFEWLQSGRINGNVEQVGNVKTLPFDP